MPMSPEFIGMVLNNDACTLKPRVKGLYVAYVNDEFVTRYAKKIILFFDGDRWGYPGSDQNYRDSVYAWLGPLPAMELKE